MLFSDGTAPETIRKLLEASPPLVDGDFELCGRRYPLIHSQPVPHPFSWDDPPKLVELYFVQLVDFRNGHSIFSSCNQP